MPTNALIHEKSPYLLQHAHNPVAWLPWSEAAFAKARSEDKPIFLSVGYSTCHWCHVMEHESFENEAIADILNADFVPIKVDREERPDVDRIYMLFVQASTGSGGWPMSVWLTPELKPFYGGTYFPPDSRYGRPGFSDVLKHIASAWKGNRGQIQASSERVLEQLRQHTATARSAEDLNAALFESGFPHFRRSFDKQWGGFGGAPKFPRPAGLNYLLRHFAATKNPESLEMVTETLQAMAKGGMHDQLGGGFHRYSVDGRWFVPHFEKMLYDQAQLAMVYVDAFQITGEAPLAATARDIFHYVMRDMTHPEGGFYSAEDADSAEPENPAHKGEGAFYIWREKEIDALLGKESAALFRHRYGVEPDGNVSEDPHREFTGRNILFEAFDAESTAREYRLDPARVQALLSGAAETLFAARNQRPRPHLDDKVLTSWNSLMISAMARGYQALGDADLLTAALRAKGFVESTLYQAGSGTLMRRFGGGEAAIPGFLDDYAFFAQASIDLFETDFDPRHLELAVDLATRGFGLFEDEEEGGFFSTEAGDPNLVLRIKDDYDGAEPSGNSVATHVLIRLAHITGDDKFRRRAERSLRAFAAKLKEQPTAAPQMLVALGALLAEPEHIVIRCHTVDARVERELREYRRTFAPERLLAAVADQDAGRVAAIAPFVGSLERKGEMTVYECRNFACQLPRVIA